MEMYQPQIKCINHEHQVPLFCAGKIQPLVYNLGKLIDHLHIANILSGGTEGDLNKMEISWHLLKVLVLVYPSLVKNWSHLKPHVKISHITHLLLLSLCCN